MTFTHSRKGKTQPTNHQKGGPPMTSLQEKFQSPKFTTARLISPEAAT